MSFQTIPKIETADKYIDYAFRQGRERAMAMKLKRPNHTSSTGERKNIETAVFTAVANYLCKIFDNILKAFPQSEELNPFYKELLDCTLEIGEFKHSLGAVTWAKISIEKMHDFYVRKLKSMREESTIIAQRKIFYGRISSIVKQIKNELIYLDEVRRELKEFPVIKEGITTVALFGFPNVGKTTLLSKLSGSKPEIANYSFTTKSINLGYIILAHKKIQLLDTPGTLNRFEKMNDIERQAYLALKHVANAVVYIFDLSEASYPIEDQIRLYESLKQFKKPILVYFSKTDVIDKAHFESVRKRVIASAGIEGFTDAAELGDALLKLWEPTKLEK